jgi:hypothetical protein
VGTASSPWHFPKSSRLVPFPLAHVSERSMDLPNREKILLPSAQTAHPGPAPGRAANLPIRKESGQNARAKPGSCSCLWLVDSERPPVLPVTDYQLYLRVIVASPSFWFNRFMAAWSLSAIRPKGEQRCHV